jgi:hypothetical protein
MAVQEADDSDQEDEDNYEESEEQKAKAEMRSRGGKASAGKTDVTWIGDMILDDGKRKFYRYLISTSKQKSHHFSHLCGPPISHSYGSYS